jgi:ubiquinone biosynthesis protein
MRVIRFVGRAFWISLLLLLQGLLWLLGWIAALITFRGRAARQAWFGQRLADTLIALGATFVKVGQIMSTRPDLFPPHVMRALTRLQDNVGAFAWRDVERTIIEDLGKPPD